MDMGEIRHNSGKNTKLERARADDLLIISSRPVQNRVIELLVSRILQQKR